MRDARILAHKLRVIGEQDARAGKPIEAFYSVPAIKYSEVNRASYEIGYRAAKAEILKKPTPAS